LHHRPDVSTPDALVVIVLPDGFGGGAAKIEHEAVIEGYLGDVHDELAAGVKVGSEILGVHVQVAGGRR